MRLLASCLLSLIAITSVSLGFAQATPAVLGSVIIMTGQGANITTRVQNVNPPLRVWVSGGLHHGLPHGVTMTSTFAEPGTGQVTLHFEADAHASPVSRSVYISAGNGFTTITYRINVSVRGHRPAGTHLQFCGVPSLQPIDQSTQAVLVSHVTSNCTVEVWVGDTNGLRPVASAPVSAGTADLRVRLPHRLSPGQLVRVLARRRLTSRFGAEVVVENNYVTNRYDNERSGWNPNEATLTVNTVAHLTRFCDRLVGAPIHAQPLYIQDVDIPGMGRHNVVYVATESDSVWAFDADSCHPNDRGLWLDATGNPGPRSLINSNSGERAVTAGEHSACSDQLGITATPVVDRTTNTIYVVELVFKNNNVIYELHALDISTGDDRPGSPVEISSNTVQFKGVSFNPDFQGNRPGLLLDNGVLYLGFGSCFDQGDYHGWVVAYEANIPGSSTFLHQLGVFNTSPKEYSGSGVWQEGLGLAADGHKNIYLITGNGSFDKRKGNYGNTLLDLRLPLSTSMEMEVVKFFTPYDWASAYNPGDNDFGSGGPVLLTEHSSGPLAATSKRLIVGGGKVPKSYLINLHCAHCSGDPNRCIAIGGMPCTSNDHNMVLQEISNASGTGAGPAYYTGSNGTRIFYGLGLGNPLKAYDFSWSPPRMTLAEVTPDIAPGTSPIPTVSSNGSMPGTGILWAIFFVPYPNSDTLLLYAYDANNLQHSLFTNALNVGTWEYSNFHNAFQVPTVIHGKVFSCSKDRLVVFAP